MNDATDYELVDAQDAANLRHRRETFRVSTVVCPVCRETVSTRANLDGYPIAVTHLTVGVKCWGSAMPARTDEAVLAVCT